MKKQITLKDMSKILGMSISTISKALNDSCEISDKTKAIVKKAAIAHNYVPNYFASSLRRDLSKINNINNPLINKLDYKQFLKEIMDTSQLKNYKYTLYQPQNRSNDLTQLLQISETNIQGIIVLFSDDS